MQDDRFDEVEYLKSVMDEPDKFALHAWDARAGKKAQLRFEFDDVLEHIKQSFGLVSLRRYEIAGYGEQIEFSLQPEGTFKRIRLALDGASLSSNGLSGREFYRFVTTYPFNAREHVKLYVVYADIGYSWLLPQADEEEAIIHMLSHDDDVRAELGLPEYDHSQW